MTEEQVLLLEGGDGGGGDGGDAARRGGEHVTVGEIERRLVATGRAAGGADVLAARLEHKLGVPRICVIFAYRNQLPLQDRQPQLFNAVPYMAAFLGAAPVRNAPQQLQAAAVLDAPVAAPAAPVVGFSLDGSAVFGE